MHMYFRKRIWGALIGAGALNRANTVCIFFWGGTKHFSGNLKFLQMFCSDLVGAIGVLIAVDMDLKFSSATARSNEYTQYMF